MARLTLDGGAKVRTFPPPPRHFDPLTASRGDLLKHGFPARPDHPEHLERYNRIFGAMKDRFQYIQPTFRVNPERRHGTAAERQFNGAITPDVGTGNQFNPIWSGSVAFPAAGQSFRWIVSEWTVPNVSAPADGETYYCATWIGIDGDPSVAAKTFARPASTWR